MQKLTPTLLIGTRQASKILDFSLIEIRYNADWLDQLTYSDLLKLMAKTTVQQLLERDMFQNRLKKICQSMLMK